MTAFIAMSIRQFTKNFSLGELQTSFICVLSSILASVEHELSLLELRKDVSRRESSWHLSGLFLKGRAGNML